MTSVLGDNMIKMSCIKQGGKSEGEGVDERSWNNAQLERRVLSMERSTVMLMMLLIYTIPVSFTELGSLDFCWCEFQAMLI